LAAEHRHFMTEHHDLDGEITALSPKELEQLEDSDERQVQEGQRHGSVLT
jgi:HAMP domain-containing protein